VLPAEKARRAKKAEAEPPTEEERHQALAKKREYERARLAKNAKRRKIRLKFGLNSA
jgi:hypothetical protein